MNNTNLKHCQFSDRNSRNQASKMVDYFVTYYSTGQRSPSAFLLVMESQMSDLKKKSSYKTNLQRHYKTSLRRSVVLENTEI